MNLLAQIEAGQEVTKETLNELNPLVIAGSPYADTFKTPGGIISRALDFAFPIAGLILFVMIVWGGFEMLSTASSKKSMDDGRKRITTAITGYILLFLSYWIMRVLEMMFGVTIVSF